MLLIAVLACAGPAAAQKLVTQGGPFSNLSAQDFAATFANPPAGSGILFNSAPAVRRESSGLVAALRCGMDYVCKNNNNCCLQHITMDVLQSCRMKSRPWHSLWQKRHQAHTSGRSWCCLRSSADA